MRPFGARTGSLVTMIRNPLDPTTLRRGMMPVHQGDWIVSDDPEAVLVTVLGSCIGACVRDRVAGVGGMNHFLLAEPPGSAPSRFSATARYGAFAMEALINAVLQRGTGNRRNLEFKLFGGGRIHAALTDVGARNAAFALGFLAEEGYEAAGQDLGGDCARKVMFMPHSGRAFVRRLEHMSLQALAEQEMARAGKTAPDAPDIELF
jgi:chemotaxis protein CheD